MWVVLEKYVDECGWDFIVVLLDFEGIDVVGVEGRNDDIIFILSVFFSFVLIYNFVGVFI